MIHWTDSQWQEIKEAYRVELKAAIEKAAAKVNADNMAILRHNLANKPTNNCTW